MGGSDRGEALDIKSAALEKRREMILQPHKIIQERASGWGWGWGSGEGRVSVFNLVVRLSLSPHRDDNQLTSQCFKLSSLQTQISESP